MSSSWESSQWHPHKMSRNLYELATVRFLPEAGKSATFWGTMLNWANGLKFIGLGYCLAGLREDC